MSSGWGGVIAAIAITLVVQSLTSMAMISPPVLAPVAAPALGVAAQSVGMVVSLSYLFAMLSGLVVGTLIGRLGPLRVCQLSLVLAGAGLALGALGTLSAVLAGAVLMGAGYGLVTPASSHILARRAPASMMSLIFSIKQTGVPIGGALAGALIPWLLLHLTWLSSLVVLGSGCIVVAAALQFAQPRRDPDVVDDDEQSDAVSDARRQAEPLRLRWRRIMSGVREPIRLVWRHPRLRELAFVSLLYASVQLVFITYFVSYLTLQLGFSLVTAGLAYAVGHGAGIVGRIAWGAVADRWLAPRVMLALLGLGSAVSGLLAALFGSAWPLAAIVAVAALFGASTVGWNGVYLAEVARRAPAGQVSLATGGTQFFTFSGALCGPPLFGLAVSLTGSYAWGFALFALPSLAVGLYLLRTRR